MNSSSGAPLDLDGQSVLQDIQESFNTSRTEVFYGVTDFQVGVHGPAIRSGRYKLICETGGEPGGWNPPPSATTRDGVDTAVPERPRRDLLWGSCDEKGVSSLLFDLEEDPYEHHEISQAHPDIVA